MNAVTRVAAVSLVLAMAGPAYGQSLPISVDLTGRLQFQFNSTSVNADDLGEPISGSMFEARRIRLGAVITIGDWIHGLIEPEFAVGSLQLRQAWAALEIDPALVIRAGQFKKPFSLIHLTSSTAHPMIERGLRIRRLRDVLDAQNAGELSAFRGVLLMGEHYALLESQGYLAYDLGVSIEGERAGFGWSIGVFNGNGLLALDENYGKSLAGRLTYTFDVGAPLTLGGAWSRREVSWPTPQDLDTRTGDAFEIDAELGGLREGWWLLAELASGTNLATEARFLGAQGALAYFHGLGGGRIEGIEPMARVSWGNPDEDIDGDAGLLVTPGVNLYFVGRNRLMFNWDVYMAESDRFETQHALRAQINLYF